MREIKFRVWDKMGNMIKPFTLHELKAEIVQQFTCDCPVMQYTGLKDVNGVEIYEDDVVMLTDEYDVYKSIIKWGGDYPAFDVYDIKTGLSMSHEFNVLSCPDFSIAVIGNVHQNPELLESK